MSLVNVLSCSDGTVRYTLLTCEKFIYLYQLF